MEKPKPNPDPHPQQQPLKCPRCDSSNTKFCYYNNYSLSQPRHFCKACKRYWTRGGTLRSIPVGGGCRKNKRVKRPSPPQLASSAATSHVHAPHHIDLSPPSNHMSSSLYYNNNPLELNFPFLRFGSSKVSSGFDFYQPNLNRFGLGFWNSVVLPSEVQEDPVNVFGSGSSSRVGNGILNGIEVKMEDGNRLVQQLLINSSSDANNSSLLWNTSNISSWVDLSNNNMGSSVPSLI